MVFTTLILSFLLLLPLLMGGVLTLFIWMNRMRVSEGTPLLSLLGIILGESLYSATYSIEFLLPDETGFMALVLVRYSGMLIFMLSMICFVFWYIGLWTSLGKMILTLFTIPGILILILIATNQYHHQYYATFQKISEGIPHFIHTNGLFYYPVQIYGLFLLVLIFLLLLYWMSTSPRSYNPVIWLFLLASLSPLTGLILYILGIRPLGFINLTPFSLIFSAVLLTIAFTKYHLYALRPMAYREIINEIPGGILFFDENLRIIEINKGAASILSVSEKDVLDKRIDTVIPHDHPVIEFLAMNDSGTMEFRAGDRYFYVTRKIHTGRKNEEVGTLLLFTDITRQKSVEADLKDKDRSLQNSEARYRQLLDNAPDLIWQLNAEGVFTYVSPSWFRILGYHVEFVLGKNFRDFVHPDDISGCERYLTHSINKSETRTGIEYRVLHADQSWHWHFGSLIVYSPDTGEEISVIGTSRDIHNAKITEIALKNANRQLNLLSSITRHDILNGITAMMAYLDLAKSYHTEPEVERIIDKLEQIVPIIQSQIEFTRVYEVLGSHEPIWQNIAEILDKKRIAFSFLKYYNSSLYEVFADPMLERVFDNLLENSMRHGERVTEISISCIERQGWLEIIYQDNGAGIPLNMKTMIFERGYGKNTGMGLFLVREILQLTGISISEIGSYGTGAIFEIRVPTESFRRIGVAGDKGDISGSE